MEIFLVIVVFLALFALAFGVWAAIVGWGIIPLVELFGGPELPFWPTLLALWGFTVIFSVLFTRK